MKDSGKACSKAQSRRSQKNRTEFAKETNQQLSIKVIRQLSADKEFFLKTTGNPGMATPAAEMF
jgi:hypothetical protein